MSTELLEEPTTIPIQEPIVSEFVEDQSLPSIVQNNYNKLFCDGVLLHLNVRMWGMSVSLNEEDIGVSDLPNIFRLGKKMLIKPSVFNEFKRVEGKARGYLKTQSHPFPVAEAHFVKNSQLAKVCAKLDSYKEEFDILTATFIDKYEDHRREVLAENEQYRTVLEPFYPSINSIRGKFSFQYTQFRIALPEQLETTNFHVMRQEQEQVNQLVAQHQERLRIQAIKQNEMLKTFVEDVALKLRNNVTAQCNVVLQKIRKGELVSKTNIRTLMKQFTSLEELNLVDDQVMNEQLKNLKALLNQDIDYKDQPIQVRILETELQNVLDSTSKISDVSQVAGKYFLRALQIDEN